MAFRNWLTSWPGALWIICKYGKEWLVKFEGGMWKKIQGVTSLRRTIIKPRIKMLVKISLLCRASQLGR